MLRKPLGRTGTSVSALCYGTMSFGGDADEAQSAKLYAACRDAGIDFFDCANVYQNGTAEEILGRLIAHEREEITLTTKFASDKGGSRRNVLASVEASLKRLGTDRIDVLFMHRWDPEARLEDTLRALDDLVRQGKVLYLGASNYAAWQLATALGVQKREGWARFDVFQPMYNLVKRQAEVEILPLCAAEDVAVVPYNPLAAGVLTGKYLPDEGAGNARGRLDQMEMYAKRYAAPWVEGVVREFVAFAKDLGVSPVTLADAWVAAHPAVTAPIIGARNVEQLAPAIAAADYNMTEDVRAKISALSPTPVPATDRLEELG
ncbi:aldo/keto reductase [Oceanicella sp. SM1341]|uniref:aldo/keto reductase n=1 Tax=Oceanicella sp. SM1341 TaxID=1548889 RepID=UPI000E4B2A74|nr:aldo/keto reductase [Oceanicella sp. SM1341]